MLPDALARALHEAALVVVQAPAGYGKTTSVHAALDGAPDVAWYDAQPWEADAFAEALLARVRIVRPDVGRLTLALAEQRADPERLGAAFAEELTHVDAPLRIVVDDAHVLGASFGAFARSLARRMPDPVRLVLLARVPLDVGLPEAIAAGRGALVDANVLRFDVARARSLASELGVALDDARAAALVARTEGWPIAVALALRAPEASDALLDELVAHRLDALGDADRALLEATAAYETVEPDVVAPGEPAFAARFAAFAGDASLVAPVRGGYRVHPLVREALARRVGERALAARHADAARAYARAGRLRPALFHLDRAHDAAADVAFLRAHAPSAIASGLVDGVRGALARVRGARSDEPALICLVEGLLAKARGDDGRASFAEAAREADARGDDALAFEARLQAVEADLARSEPVAAERVDDMLARAPAHGPAALGKAIVRAGWADAVGGRFAHALARLDALADGGDPAIFADVAPLAAYAHIALGDFEAAEHAANTLIETWSAGDDLVRYFGALVWAARFALLRGETTAAYELAREAERIARPFALRPQAASLHGALAEASLHAGDTTLARREARAALRSADAAWYARDAQRVRTLASRILARADALDGDLLAALAASGDDDPLARADAATFAALANASDAPARRERARAALTAATPVDGDDAVALWAAAETLDLLDALDGRDVETPLRSAPFDGLIARRAEPPRLAALGTILRGIARGTARAADYDDALARATRGGARFDTHVAVRLAAPYLRGRDAPPPADEQLEPLTAREREILELLAAGLTNREIAQRLVVSARTVETHVARVTGKLGVNSRARAVARAVARGILGAAREYPTL
ncbi:MAG TPA: LuxR C-terminal-related transcriptional regulator [Candidatus Elarobacter sp.]|nr:LuxR C-terminal-related transcriptional regulator [Candidatus Elarobacter sp.]